MTKFIVSLVRKTNLESALSTHRVEASTIQIRDGVYIFHGRGAETVAAFPIREYYVKVES